jgi:hypothetical protein
MGAPPLRVGILKWKQNDAISKGLVRGIDLLEHIPVEFPQGVTLPDNLDLVIAHGPFGSLVPLCKQLIRMAPGQRPAFALIMTEQLPSPALPEWFRFNLGKARSWVERLAYTYSSANGCWRVAPSMDRLLGKGTRYRYYGDLYWMRDQGILSVLALWSYWTADFLRARGFDPLVLSGGIQQDWGRDLQLERDIPVLWIGKPGSARREKMIHSLREQLRLRNVEMVVVDGKEQPYVFGEKRTVLLNKTKIVVNLLREPWDDNSMRYALAAHNRALVVTEPTLPHTSHRPGVHVVEAPFEQMADTICHYLAHEEERQRIVENAYQLISGSQDSTSGISAIIDRVLKMRDQDRIVH